MQKQFCDLCGKESEEVNNTIGRSHWCGNFKISDIRAEVELNFDSEICYNCRVKFEKELLKRTELEHWAPSLGA